MNRFPKKRRLNTKKEFDQVFEQPQKVVLFNFIFFFRKMSAFSLPHDMQKKNHLVHSRLGMIIPKKKIAKAHDRNRIKRLIRESFRSKQWSGLDVVVLARKEVKSVTNQSLRKEMEQAWKKIEQS